MPKLTDRELIEKLKTVHWTEEFERLISLASTFLSLKEGLENGELVKKWQDEVMNNFETGSAVSPGAKGFIDWLLTHIEKEVK